MPVHPAGVVREDEVIVFPNNARMIGVIDMVSAIRSGRMPRANGANGYPLTPDDLTVFEIAIEVAICSKNEFCAGTGCLPIGL